ncbi:MAG: heat-inducible transcription repressor HrcA [Fimbriimonadaceae bacterium]|nr:heat-inducible transcription repressor HrcA [Fimbriimonadaceae bacterium]
MSELGDRKQLLLRAVIIEYVHGAEPISSELLSKKYDLGVKSATIRNELAEMSDQGYLEQPHTSAGRIPSDKGYRFYVDHLIESSLPKKSKEAVGSHADEGETLQQVLAHTTASLSRFLQLLSAAITYSERDLAVRSVIVSAIGPVQALLVVVLSNGHIENRVVEIPPGLTLDELGSVNALVNKSVAGKLLRQLQRVKAPIGAQDSTADKLLQIIWGVLRSISRERTRGKLVTEGEEFLFGQPEFRRDAEAFSDLLAALTEPEALYEALSGTSDQTGTVTIGRENRSEKLRKLSVVKQTFYVGEHEAGTIAIIGPTRMPYDSSIPLVNFTAKALSEGLTKFFG